MLVYEGARHNTGGNPPPPGLTSLALVGGFEEPVWRKERITSINQHFVTAFLDLYLKHDQTRRDYLHLAPAHSGEGAWKLAPGTPDTGGFSTGKDAEGNLFWRGFQRRWALGMEMSCSPAK